MASIRSVNRRHQRAIVTSNARRKAAEVAVAPVAEPVKAVA